MDFRTDLIKLMPKKFRDGPSGPWTVLFEKFGEILNEVHADITGLADLTDRDRVPDEFLNYLADHYGVPLVIAPSTEDAARRRMYLKSLIDLIKSKGQEQVFLDIADFLYLSAFYSVDMEAYELWTVDYLTFTVNPFNLYETPYDGFGDGVTTQFLMTLSYTPVRAKSVKVTTVGASGGTLEAKDDGNGELVGDVVIGSTIDYTTGDINITFTEAPMLGADIYVYWTLEDNQYLSPHLMLAFSSDVYLRMGADPQSEEPSGWIGDGSQTTFTTTLSKKPVGETSVRITATSVTDQEMVVTDDGDGFLTGDVGTGNNTIDYTTGAVDVSFDEAVKLDEVITVEYDHLDLFLGKERLDRLITILDRWRPVHVVIRTNIGLATDFWRVGVHHDRVGGSGSPAVPDGDQIRIGGLIWLS